MQGISFNHLKILKPVFGASTPESSAPPVGLLNRPEAKDILDIHFSGLTKPQQIAPPQETKAVVYAGSFDPPTYGHLYMIEEAHRMFGKVVVVMAVNPAKNYTFSQTERLEMLREMTKHLPNVEITTLHSKKFLAKFAKQIGAVAMIRGMRNTKDFEEEWTLNNLNRKAEGDVGTVLLFTPKDLAEVSSSTVKGLTSLIGWREMVSTMVPPPVFQHLKIKFLQDRFLKLAEKLSLPKEVALETFEFLKSHYDKPERAYHNLDHLIDIFEEYDTALIDAPELTPKNPALFEWSLWFHDVIDDRKNKQGVQESADLAVKFLKKSTASKYCALAWTNWKYLSGLILSTQYGQKQPEGAPPFPEDHRLFNDIDTAILGQATEKYNRYAGQIGTEYDHVDIADYKKGRAYVLGKFLAQTHQYYTPYFRQKYEAQAQQNLSQEIAQLLPVLQPAAASS